MARSVACSVKLYGVDSPGDLWRQAALVNARAKAIAAGVAFDVAKEQARFGMSNKAAAAAVARVEAAEAAEAAVAVYEVVR